MNTSQSALWTKLESFTFGQDTDSLTFEQRLARENHWTASFTARAILEYKKFLFLCAQAGQPCSPSPVVDEVWHFHLTYTRSYWDDLCRNVIGRPLHHDPTTGGTRETAKFEDWYRQTLSSYELFFGVPPEDVWPATLAASRTGEQADYWTIPKRPVKFLSALVLGGMLLAGCRAGSEIGFVFILFLIIVIIVFVAVALGKGRWNIPGGGACSGSGCGSDGGGCGGGCGGGD